MEQVTSWRPAKTWLFFFLQIYLPINSTKSASLPPISKREMVYASSLTSSDHTDLTFMSVLLAPDHTYSEGPTGPLHLYPGGLGKVRHFITLKEERGHIFISRSAIQWQAAERGGFNSGKALLTHRPNIPWGFTLHVWSLCVSLRAVCLHAHGQYDNTDGQRWVKTRKTIKSGLWPQLWELDFRCPPLPIWKRLTNTHTHSIFFFSTLGSVT